MPVHMHISFTLRLKVCCLNETPAGGDRELLYFISSPCVIWRFLGLDRLPVLHTQHYSSWECKV